MELWFEVVVAYLWDSPEEHYVPAFSVSSLHQHASIQEVRPELFLLAVTYPYLEILACWVRLVDTDWRGLAE
jgi:hypothetical protein